MAELPLKSDGRHHGKGIPVGGGDESAVAEKIGTEHIVGIRSWRQDLSGTRFVGRHEICDGCVPT